MEPDKDDQTSTKEAMRAFVSEALFADLFHADIKASSLLTRDLWMLMRSCSACSQRQQSGVDTIAAALRPQGEDVAAVVSICDVVFRYAWWRLYDDKTSLTVSTLGAAVILLALRSVSD